MRVGLSASWRHAWEVCDSSVRTWARRKSGKEHLPRPVLGMGLYLGSWDIGAEQPAWVPSMQEWGEGHD